MRPGFLLSFAMIAASALTACAATQPPPPMAPQVSAPAAAAQFTDIVHRLPKASGRTGAAILIFDPDGNVLYQASTGSLTPDDPIFVASASKWVAAALLMTLVDEGLLDLDVPASLYAPYLAGDKAGITLRQMFSHTSGMNSGHAVEEPPEASLQTFARTLAALPLENPPGTVMSYGGVSMQIAGAIMEEVAGQSFQSLFLERLAGPLGMEGAYFCHPLDCPLASPEEVTNPLVGGGLKISAASFGNFLRMLSAGGVYEGRRILSEAAVAELSTVLTIGLDRGSLPRIAGPEWEYALGQWCHEAEGGHCRVLQSVGAFGTYPWIDTSRGISGIFVTESLVPLVIDEIIAIRKMAEAAYDAQRAAIPPVQRQPTPEAPNPANSRR